LPCSIAGTNPLIDELLQLLCELHIIEGWLCDGWRTAQDQGEFALGAGLLKMSESFLHSGPHLFFMAFGEFSSHLDRTIGAAMTPEFIQQREESMRCFIKHGGPLFTRDLFQTLSSFFALRG
jgi:hypothetical protein